MKWRTAPAIRHQGFALVLVLWMLSLLTIMAGSFALGMRRESSIIAGVKNNAQAAAVAESGIAIAELMLLNPDQNKRWRADGSVYLIDDAAVLGSDHAEVRVRLLSETGKIDLNKADQKLLAGLLAQSPVEDEQQQGKLVGAILDWRDEDDQLSIDGAEQKEYKEAGLSYQPRNKPFQTVDELQLVLGMGGTVYEWLAPLVTVYSGQANVDVQQASKDVLQVLPDVDTSLINDYVAARLESATNGLPAPPSPFGVGQGGSARQVQGQQSAGAITIVSEALLEDGSRAMIRAVIKSGGSAQNGQPFQMLEWQRNTASDGSLFADTIGASAINELLVQTIK
ncbi:MAG: type II secretion system protein GspK [Methylovulum sp.]|nr:type II secretion system protein GspK [Methylovulum sp.]